jgi:hypothetical protein
MSSENAETLTEQKEKIRKGVSNKCLDFPYLIVYCSNFTLKKDKVVTDSSIFAQ